MARRAFGPARRLTGRALGHTLGTRHDDGTARPARQHGAAQGKHGTARRARPARPRLYLWLSYFSEFVFEHNVSEF